MATQQQLTEARNAYHQLATGKLARVVVDSDGSRVEFTATNRAALYAYIQKIEAELSPAGCLDNGPAGFLF